MERELKRLLHGTSAEHDLLGLLTAAGGGLTAADLAELTGWSTWDVDDHLRTVTGRSFRRRDAHYEPGRSPDVYLLGHEELHLKAIDMLGASRMRDYRDRLHGWADTYRDRRWPTDTPEYLLRGYFAMLTSTKDLDRMLGCCIDPARHDRMLEVSGGDAAALAEIAATQQFMLSDETPNLTAMARLAVHRDHLTGRNKWLPRDLPALWAGIGHVDRAESLATSVTTSNERDRALRAAVEAVIRLGDLDRAVDLTSSIGDLPYHSDALESVVAAIVDRGDLDRARVLITRAETTFQLVKDSRRQGAALTSVVRSLIELGEHGHAEHLAGSIVHQRFRGEALRAVVVAAAARGNLDRAIRLAHAIEDTRSRGLALLAVVEAVAGDDLDRAEALALEIADTAAQGRALTTVVRHLVERGDLEHASMSAERIMDTSRRFSALVHVPWARQGSAAFDRALVAMRATTDATDPGQSLTSAVRGVMASDDPDLEADLLRRASLGRLVAGMNQGRALLTAIYAAIAADDFDGADALTAAITDVRHRGRALQVLTESALRLGHLDRVPGFLDRIEALADFTDASVRHGQALAAAVRAATAAGDEARVDRLFARATASAHAMPDARRRSEALYAVVQAGVAVGEVSRVRQVVESITSTTYRDQAIVLIARAAVAAGDLDRAESLTRSISRSAYKGRALVAVIRAATASGDVERATRALQLATALARHTADTDWQGNMLTPVIREVVRIGDLGRAEALADSITDAAHRSRALSKLFASARQIDPERAQTLLDKAKATARGISDTYQRDRAINDLVLDVGMAGDVTEAEALAYSISDPPIRDSALSRVDTAAFVFRRTARRSTTGSAEPEEKSVASSVHAALANGDFDHAEALARSIADPGYRSLMFESLVKAAITTGDLDRATALIAAIPEAARRRFAVTNMVRRVIATGNHERAAQLVADWEAEDHDGLPAELNVEIAIASGDLDRAEALVHRTVTRFNRGSMMGLVVDAAIRAGDLDRAERLALSLIETEHSARPLKSAIDSMTDAGCFDRAARLLDRAEALARSIGEAFHRSSALVSVAEAVIAFGDHDRAVDLAHSITTPKHRGDALYAVATAFAWSGDRTRAAMIADSITVAEMTVNATSLVEDLEPGTGRRLLARAIANEDWTYNIDVLCREVPEALPAMIGELAAIARASRSA
ncbi:hypothetical protein LZG04_06145 [Saccharothrix sp. S26]|uniref:tetratricopeptide repeat protein n=1 Tax=Saccharothrix sp. S26 TaxID=2907215 RepID=UPI001F1F3AEC|nr:hypothetical protein [Saccharothrix sp. S26]MCE6994390.1 hypothetical protein [Saccharothrix sp. S26]